MGKGKRKEGNGFYKKQGFIRRNLSKIIAGAAILAGAAGIGAYFYPRDNTNSPNQPSQAAEVDEIDALEKLERNRDYITFARDTIDIKQSPDENALFARGCIATGKDPRLAKEVVRIYEKKVSLLPQTPAFQKLEQRLNEELELFEKVLPKELPKHPHRIILLTQYKDLESLPVEKDGIKQIYFVNSTFETNTFNGIYQGEPFSIFKTQEGVLGEASFNFDFVKSDNGREFKVRPCKIYISPAYDSPRNFRYPCLLNTTLSEYLHSVLTDIKVRNIKGVFNYLNDKHLLKESSMNQAVHHVTQLDEAVTHATVLLYLDKLGKYPKAVEHEKMLLGSYAGKKLEPYAYVTEFYDTINSDISPGVKLAPEDRLKPLLNMWHNGEVMPLLNGKEAILSYIRGKSHTERKE